MKYRAEIDGLRALAVLPVILFHAGFSTFAGGFVGVDVFFVISGFLITSIIYEEISQDRFSIISFYERRARRLLPALFLVCLVSIPFAWAWMLPDALAGFFESLLATNLFASNIYFWLSDDYFGIAAEHMPLLHTWSLAVEEQFYLFFPIFLLLLKRAGWSWTLVLIVMLSAFSLSVAQWASSAYPSANFYLLPTRIWELGFGAALSLWSRNHQIQSAPARSFGAYLGLGLILYAILAFDRQTPFPSVWALMPVTGTILILACTDSENLVGRMLSLRPLVFIGLISYSAYLWHQPLFAFARIRMFDSPSASLMLLLAVASLMLAYCSWRWVEVPFRRKQFAGRKVVFAISGIIGGGLAGVSAWGFVAEGFPDRLPENVLEISEASSSKNPRLSECQANAKNFLSPDEACTYGYEDNASIAIWGDSHVGALSYVLGDRLKMTNEGVKEFSYSGCPPVIGIVVVNRPGCERYNLETFEYLSTSSELKTVILHARWPLYIEQSRFNNQEGGVEAGKEFVIYPKDSPKAVGEHRVEEITQLLDAQIKRLLTQGKKVLLVYPVPEVGWNVPEYLTKTVWFSGNKTPQISTSYEIFNRRTEQTMKVLDSVSYSVDLFRVYPHKSFCNRTQKNRCEASKNGQALYSDDDHLSRIGAEKVVDLIVAHLVDNRD